MRRIKSAIKNALGGAAKDDAFAHHLRESTAFQYIGNSGREIEEIFARASHIKGWFNLDDCAHFLLVLRQQSLLGMEGDIFEIGSYHGRSTAIMATALKPSEKVVICDAFEADTEDFYQDKPTEEFVIDNIMGVARNISRDQIELHKCLSNEISLTPGRKFRFLHIDGGHSEEQAYLDLVLCAKHAMKNAIIVMDDYGHPTFPGVKAGTDRFLSEHSDIAIFADLNRHGALGRKLYLSKTA